MSKFFSSSVGQKFFMSITGFFLMSFLLVHLTVNMFLVVGDGELFNRAAHFMSTNSVMHILEPVLAIGFLLHIIYGAYITMKNKKARPVAYKTSRMQGSSAWASRNMFILGLLVLVFLIIHLANFFWHIKFGEVPTIVYEGESMKNVYDLVAGLFINWWWYDLIYVLGAILLGLHLTHGFWSAFQTIGWNNTKWLNRLKVVSYLYALIIAGGFAFIPLYFFFTTNF